MQKFTKEQIKQAVREELMEGNKQLEIADKLTDQDYFVLGVLECAFERLSGVNKNEEEDITRFSVPKIPCPECGSVNSVEYGVCRKCK